MLINLRNALMAGKRLPYDAEVEYLESTGTQYIDTGVSFSAPCSMSVSISFTPITAEKDFFGAYISTDTNKMVCGCYRKFVFLFNPPGTRVDSSSLGDSEVYANIQCVFSGSGASGTRTLTVNGSTYTQSGAYYNDRSITLFKANFFGAFKLYAFKIYDENNVLVRDYIPVRKGTTGELYDRVSGKFAERHGDFVLGADVVPVEYIESHGTEWIDTGVTAVSSPKYSMKIRCSFTTPTSPTPQYWGADNGGTYGLSSGNFLWSGGVSAVAGRVYDIFYQNAGGVRYAEVDGVRYTGSNFSSSGYKCLLFCAGQSGTRKTALFAARLYGAEFVSANNLAFKSIPVRVGTDATSWEGAMMDVLTRRIYRNAGTGAFTYGNDLKYPIPSE